jgi:hypothetical protein
MKTIDLTILKEDILLDNYMDSRNCPITKALARVGRPDVYDQGEIRIDEDVIDDCNQTYFDLVAKLFGMYNSMKEDDSYKCRVKGYTPPAIPVETFTHTLIW